MPSRPGKACRKPHCPIIVKDHSNQGYCIEHKGLAGWFGNERLKGNASQRGYGYAWQQLRKQVIDRDNHLCQACKANGIAKTGTHCDHIKPKANGGTDCMTNLQMLCVECHNTKTAKER